MLKRRVAAIEKRLVGLTGAIKKNLRIVYQFDGDPEPVKGPEEDLLVVRVVNTRGVKAEAKDEDERVLHFDFGSGEGQTGRVNNKTDDSAEKSHKSKRS